VRKFHVHINVASLQPSLDFYRELFEQAPSKIRTDYAKWELLDPPLNFAISVSNSGHSGINHLGLQMDAEQLQSLQSRLSSLEGKSETDSACCYAVSDKLWLNDPSGVSWENFHSKRDDIDMQQACCDNSCGCHS